MDRNESQAPYPPLSIKYACGKCERLFDQAELGEFKAGEAMVCRECAEFLKPFLKRTAPPPAPSPPPLPPAPPAPPPQPPAARPKFDAEGRPLCPECGSNAVHVEKRGFSAKKAGLGWLLLGPVGLAAGALKSQKLMAACLNCHHEWEP